MMKLTGKSLVEVMQFKPGLHAEWRLNQPTDRVVLKAYKKRNKQLQRRLQESLDTNNKLVS